MDCDCALFACWRTMWRLRSLLHIRTENAWACGARIMSLFCGLLLLRGSLYAGHNPLVPQPQQIQYGTGRLKLKGLRISFGSVRLQKIGSRRPNWQPPGGRDGSAVGVMNHRAAGPSIVFYRTGLVDALPGADERPGAQSRESDELRISCRRRSSRAGRPTNTISTIAGYFKTLGDHPSRTDVQFYLGWESSARNHGRIMDLMDEIADLQPVYRSLWLSEYTGHHFNSVLGRWDPNMNTGGAYRRA